MSSVDCCNSAGYSGDPSGGFLEVLLGKNYRRTTRYTHAQTPLLWHRYTPGQGVPRCYKIQENHRMVLHKYMYDHK